MGIGNAYAIIPKLTISLFQPSHSIPLCPETGNIGVIKLSRTKRSLSIFAVVMKQKTNNKYVYNLKSRYFMAALHLNHLAHNGNSHSVPGVKTADAQNQIIADCSNALNEQTNTFLRRMKMTSLKYLKCTLLDGSQPLYHKGCSVYIKFQASTLTSSLISARKIKLIP